MSPSGQPADTPEDIDRLAEAEAAERRDRKELWPHAWQMACLLDEVREIGDFIEYEIAGKSLIVLRGEGGIRVFHNRCAHRGVRIVAGAGHCEGRLTCPFHSWQWNLEGRNVFFLPQHTIAFRNRPREALDLSLCRCEIAAGHVFVTFDDGVPPLVEAGSEGSLAGLARSLVNRQVETTATIVLPVCWREAREALTRTGGAIGATDHETLGAIGEAIGQPLGEELHEVLFALPNFLALALGDALVTVRIRPQGALRCHVELWVHMQR